MKTEKINVSETTIDNIYKIIDIEQANSAFVGQYDFDKHQQVILDTNSLHLSIFDKSDNALVGYIILFGLTDPNNSIEFRRIAISRKGFGFGKDAVEWIKSICFSTHHAHRLYLNVFSDNSTAIKLYESLGFKKEGLIRECIKYNDHYRSMWTMSVLEAEYRSEQIGKKQ